MPAAFLFVGLLTIVLTVLACCGTATSYGLKSLVYFLLMLLLIGLEIGLGAYWVHIQPDYPPEFSGGPTETTTLSDIDDIEGLPETPLKFLHLNHSSLVTLIPSETTKQNRKEQNHISDKVVVASVLNVDAFKRSEDWRSFQLSFECCGINGAKDFIDRGEGVPPECCIEKKLNDTILCELNKSAQKGCLKALLVRLYVDRLILGTISIIAGTVALIMLVTSFFIDFENEPNTTYEDDPGYDCNEVCDQDDFR